MHCIEQDSLSRRRSIYGLGDEISVTEACFLETIEACVKHSPSAFNVQSARVVVLLGEYHKKFWDIVWQAVKKVTSKERLAASKDKITSFSDAYATILFYEDNKAVNELKKKFPLYKKNFRIWAEQANGMLQYAVWLTMAENEIGASLQHYNELIESEVRQWLNLPHSWKMVAQMPCGSINKEPASKTFLPLKDRIKIFK